MCVTSPLPPVLPEKSGTEVLDKDFCLGSGIGGTFSQRRENTCKVRRETGDDDDDKETIVLLVVVLDVVAVSQVGNHVLDSIYIFSSHTHHQVNVFTRMNDA